MRGIVTIWKKEVRTYATSARWYVVVALIVFFVSVGFRVMNLGEGREANFAAVSSWISFLLLFVTPVFTMRLIAEEANRGTLEMLLTSPVREWHIVLGKFLGALTAYGALFAVTLIYPAILFWYSDPDGGRIVAQYLGLLAISSAFISVGLFFSSVTDSQILAAIGTFITLITLWIAHALTPILPDALSNLGEEISIFAHLAKFERGVIDAVDVFYYLAFTAIFLVLTHRFVEARRWAA